MSRPLPSVGRVVHYYSGASWTDNDPFAARPDHGPFAAFVIDVGPEPTTVTLVVFDRNGKNHLRREVRYSETGEHMTWSWPPRTEGT